jgi:phosphate uptake regulator
MFKTVLQALKTRSFTEEIMDEFIEMIDKSKEMLVYSFKILTKKSKGKKADKKIYIQDQTINFTEQDIRRRILVHITSNPTTNLSAALALISISKDAERLGDYVKNLYELKEVLKNVKTDKKMFSELFDDIGSETIELFDMVSSAVRVSDTDTALAAIARGRALSERCEAFIESVLDSDYSNRQVVGLSLGARYIKRIACHLSNIASSIINPVTEIDFRAVE